MQVRYPAPAFRYRTWRVFIFAKRCEVQIGCANNVFNIRNSNLGDLGLIPSNTIVVRIAPQIELLKRATLCITHAGLNTALEALAQGVPMVAIPIGFDQPGVAARIAYHGVGEFVEIRNLTAGQLTGLIAKVKTNPNYRDKARWFQKVLTEPRGPDVAADIIERVFGERLGDKELVAPTSFPART